jgi:hypothetical protein
MLGLSWKLELNLIQISPIRFLTVNWFLVLQICSIAGLSKIVVVIMKL